VRREERRGDWENRRKGEREKGRKGECGIE
jgi:hypothetical protein